MKNILRISGIGLIVILSLSCKKSQPVSNLSVSTTKVTDVLYATATTGGIATDDAGAFVGVRGVCWAKSSGPTADSSRTIDGTGSGQYTSLVYGLSLGTKYYLRAYAVNSSGAIYGNEVSFTTHVKGVEFNSSLTYGTVSDVDGKNYKTIQIGTQVWMAENLGTVKFNDGTAIPLVTDGSAWINLFTPAYCWFLNNDTLYEDIYGAHYNWFAAGTGKLCPAGWHIPSDTEWQTLADFLGGSDIAGAKLKEAGSNNWTTSNSDATNASGFTALPSGVRGSYDGFFGGQGIIGGWWSSTELDPSPLSAAWARWIHADTVVLARSNLFKKNGFSVRCVKD